MRVLVMTPVYPYSGSPTEGLFNEQHALALRRAGMQVTVVVCKPWFSSKLAKVWRRYNSLADIPQNEERNGIPIVYARYFHVPQYQLPRVSIGSCARSILQAINRLNLHESFDLIQVHSSWPVGLASPTVAQALNCPFVVTLHIQDEPRLYASRKGVTLYRRMIEEASAVVAVGSALKRFAKKWMEGSGRGRLRLIPNGVDLVAVEDVLRTQPSRGNGWGHLVTVSNLWPVKGIDLNLKALKLVDQMGILWQSYTIVGDGPERSRLLKLARKLNISDRVHFTGRLPHKEALKAMVQSDIFSLPSWQEAFGVVYLEAMACGTPVIGCWGQGAEDIVQDGKNGLLVQPHDERDLAMTLGKLLKDPNLSRSLGIAALSRAREFTWERNATQYKNLYQEIHSQQMQGL